MEPILAAIATYCPNLQKLIYYDHTGLDYYKLDTKFIFAVCRACRKLRCLDIQTRRDTDNVLHEIHWNEQDLDLLRTTMPPNLTELTWPTSYDNIHAPTLRQLGSSRSLTSLKLVGACVYDQGDDNFIDAWEPFRGQMKELTLFNTVLAESDLLEMFAQDWPQLLYLGVSRDTTIPKGYIEWTPAVTAAVAKHCRRLKHVELHDYAFDEDDGTVWNGFEDVYWLRRLSLSAYDDQMSLKTLLRLITRSHHLEEIYMEPVALFPDTPAISAVIIDREWEEHKCDKGWYYGPMPYNRILGGSIEGNTLFLSVVDRHSREPSMRQMEKQLEKIFRKAT